MLLKELTDSRCQPHIDGVSLIFVCQLAYDVHCFRHLSDTFFLFVAYRACFQEASLEIGDTGYSNGDYHMYDKQTNRPEIYRRLVRKIHGLLHKSAHYVLFGHILVQCWRQSNSNTRTIPPYNQSLPKSVQEIPGYTRGSFWPPCRLGPSAVTSSADGIFVFGVPAIIPQGCRYAQ